MSSGARRNSTTVRSQTAVRLTKAALQAAFVLSDELGTSFAERLFTTPRRHPRPERERGILASGWRFTIDVPLRSPRWRGHHTQIAAWRWGYGPTALLVHGWEGRGSQLGALVEPLVRSGLSVVAFDAPGHGDSPGNRLYLTDLADCVVAAAAATGPVHALIAHSFGAAASLLAFHRGGVAARRNIMISPNVLIDDSVARFARVVALDERDRTTLEYALADHTGLGLEALRLDALVGRRDSALLVVHDREDREVPFHHAERLAATWRDATLLPTTGLGHRKILRDDAVVADIAAFARDGLPAAISPLVHEVDRLLAGSDL